MTSPARPARASVAGRALPRLRPGLAAALLAALLGACGEDRLAGGDGGGMETTNGISAIILRPDGQAAAGVTIRIRRADFIAEGAAPASGQGRDTLTDSGGRFEVRDLEPGAYTVEASSGDAYGWVFQNLRLPEREGVTDLGTRALEGTGSLRGVVNVANLPAGNRLRLGIYGLERQAEPDSGGAYAFEGLAPGSYELLVSSDSVPVTGKAAVFASVHAQGQTSLDSVFLPLDYRSDSLALSAYLERQGIRDFDWSARTTAYTNRIRTLRLHGLGLTALDPSIGRLGFINSLYLDGNPLASLPDSLRRMGLFILSLDSVPLASLPPQVLEQTRLRTLSLSHTGLKDLPPGLAGLSGLASLSLEGNGMDSLPPAVFSFSQLTVLRIGGNPLDSLPEGLQALSRLEQLSVHGAGLASLPGWITGFAHLSVLQAFNNRLAALPDSLGRLSNLKVLALGRNRLASLPASLGACTRLAALRVPENLLTTLPGTLLSLDLGDVDVTGNSLCDPAPDLASWLDARTPGWKASQKGCP